MPPRIAFPLTCLALVGFAAVAPAQPAHEHQHAHASDASSLVSKLEMDAGKPWPTDESLRSGMVGIRAAFDADHPAIHAGKQTDAQYAALAGRIEQHVNAIVAHCKLPPAADAQLHYVVGDLLQGVSLMRGADSSRSRHDGAALVHGALLAYGRYFDDPSWTGEASPHAGH